MRRKLWWTNEHRNGHGHSYVPLQLQWEGQIWTSLLTAFLSQPQCINSLAPGRSECNSKNVIFYLVLLIAIYRSSHDDILWWMPQDLTDDHKSTLVQVMAWCRQAPSHYLSQCCLSSLSPYGVARPQWVNPQPEPVLTWLQQARAYSAPPAVSRSSISKLSRINKWNVICRENIAALNYSIPRKNMHFALLCFILVWLCYEFLVDSYTVKPLI